MNNLGLSSISLCFYSPCGGVIPPHLQRTMRIRDAVASAIWRQLAQHGLNWPRAKRGEVGPGEKWDIHGLYKNSLFVASGPKIGVLMSLDCLELVGMGFHRVPGLNFN